MVFETGPTRECGYELFQRQAANLDQLHYSARLQRVLETPGVCAVAQQGHGADPERRRLVGSGRLLWSDQDLRAARASRHGETELSGRWSMESWWLVQGRRQ